MLRTRVGGMTVTNLADPVMYADPYPRYAELRRNAPVSRVKAPFMIRGTGYMLTRYADVMTLHTDERFSTDVMTYGGQGRFSWLLPQTIRLLTETMVFKDDPDHKRLRNLVHAAFTPKLVARMSEQVTEIANELADGLAGRPDIEFVEDFAVQLPLRVIAAMLGVGDADRVRFHALVGKMVGDSSGAGPVGMIRRAPTANKLLKFFEYLADEARAHPDEGLISGLVQAGEDGDKLTDREVLAMIFLLLLAGHDTTASLIGSSTLALVRNPDQLAALRANPDLWDTGIEELLRFTTPVVCGTTRYALDDIEIAGSTIPKGAQVLGMIISANRDESRYENPDTLDLARRPNKHLSFSFGAHYCLGHHLARLEGRAALTALLGRFQNLEVTVPYGRLRYKPTLSLRGLEALPMRVG